MPFFLNNYLCYFAYILAMKVNWSNGKKGIQKDFNISLYKIVREGKQHLMSPLAQVRLHVADSATLHWVLQQVTREKKEKVHHTKK